MARIIKKEPAVDVELETATKLRAYLRGELTWAEVEGMTLEEARAIGQVGCELAAAGRLQEARVIFEGLVEGNPKDAAVRAALGTVYQKLGREEDARAEYEAALSYDAQNPVALGNRGELRLRAGDREGFADLARAVEADPGLQSAAGRRAMAIIRAITVKAVEGEDAR
jgi:Flp pilus assembly protein TadD